MLVFSDFDGDIIDEGEVPTYGVLFLKYGDNLLK